MSSPDNVNISVPFVNSSNVVGQQVQINYPNQGDEENAVCPYELRAVTWPEGRRIDLRWTNPPGVTRIVIKRSKVFHSAFITDEAEVIYNGAAIEHFIDGKIIEQTIGHPDTRQTPSELEVGVPNTGVDLAENEFYYYTLYMTVADEPIGIIDFGLEAAEGCQVTGLSAKNYLEGDLGIKRGDGEWMYERHVGDKTREKDLSLSQGQGRETGYWQDHVRYHQGAISLYRAMNEGLLKLGDPSKMPAGLVGRAQDQASILKAFCRKLGWKPERLSLDVSVLRRLAQSSIFFYKEKGTCAGLVDLTKILTLWDSTCEGFDTSGCNKVFFETWDGETEKLSKSNQASLLTIAAGSLSVPGNPFVEDDYFAGGLFRGPMGDSYKIASNTLQTLVFEDTTAVVLTEDLVTTTAQGGGLVTFTADDGHPINDGEYDGYVFLDNNNDPWPIIGTFVTAGVAQINVGAPVTLGAGAIAPSYLLGAAFANRDPQFLFDVYKGCPSLIWDPLIDNDLQLTDEDPFHYIWSGGALKGIPFYPGDHILTIAAGVADFVGTSTGVSGLTLTDSTADFGPNDSLKHYALNPNHNQTGLFRIVRNTKTTITVVSDYQDVDLEDVAVTGSTYFILDRPKQRKYETLARLLPNSVADRVFIHFAP